MSVTCLYRRPSGIYAVRVRVPERLRALVGKTEIHVSTGLTTPAAARIAALHLQHEIRRTLMMVELRSKTVTSPIGGDLLPVAVAAKSAGVDVELLLSELRNLAAPLFTQGMNWRGLEVQDTHEITDYDGSLIVNEIEAHGTPALCSSVMRAFNAPQTIENLRTSGSSEEKAFHTFGSSLFWMFEVVSIPLSAWMAPKAAIHEAIDRISHRFSAPVAVAPLPAIPVSAAESFSPHYAPPHVAYMDWPFSRLYESYAKSKNHKPENVKRMHTEAHLFIDLMGDPKLGDITPELILSYSDQLELLPTDVYQAKRRFNIQNTKDLIDIAQKNKLELKKKRTAAGHVAKLGEILQWGAEKDYIYKNYAAGFKKDRGLVRTTSPKSDRDEFSEEDLKSIFTQELFTSGTGNPNQWRPYQYWIPILAHATGARVNELAQLYIKDIVKSDKGVYYIDFNLESEYKDKNDIDKDDLAYQDKSLKTISSFRVVPLPDKIIELGFIEYIGHLKHNGYLRVFPEIKIRPTGGYGKPVSSWFNEKFLGKKLNLVRNGKKCFHSFRHTYITELFKHDNIKENTIARLAGHSYGKTESLKRYAKNRMANALKRYIDMLEFPYLENVGRFDNVTAMISIKQALKLKEANARRKSKTET